jgi:hypothetical protein
MARPHLRNLRKEHHWRQLLARYQHSGLTVRAFCSREGCSEPSFVSARPTTGGCAPTAHGDGYGIDEERLGVGFVRRPG